jgi:hypothetical protein
MADANLKPWNSFQFVYTSQFFKILFVVYNKVKSVAYPDSNDVLNQIPCAWNLDKIRENTVICLYM